jgi:hypothetical protein
MGMSSMMAAREITEYQRLQRFIFRALHKNEQSVIKRKSSQSKAVKLAFFEGPEIVRNRIV